MDLPRRLHHLAKEAGALIDRLAPAVVVVEEAFYHESVRSTLVLGHVRGALMVAAVERGVEIAEYTPREIKLAVVGNGGAAKEQVEFMVRRILGLPDPVQADAADALAGALCHLNRSRFATARSGSRSSKGFEALLARAAR
jgi:crossover junction endodeoxyribonuclease RuvC